jgi:hypothetical protein
MIKKFLKAGLLSLVMYVFAGCFPDHSDLVPIVNVDPSDARALAQVLILPDGSSRRSNGFPSPTNGPAPTVRAINPLVFSSNGGTIPLVFGYSNVSSGIGGCYVQVIGAEAYFDIPRASPNSGSSGTISVPLGIPTNVLSGRFCIRIMIYDGAGRISNIAESCVDVLRLGTGSLQVSLSWTNGTDQDLYVTDPLGAVIYYSSKRSPSGGALDRDDTDGYGPENIFWTDNAPDGVYNIEVDDYTGTTTPNNFFVTITAPGYRTKTYEGFTRGSNPRRVLVTKVTKSGENFMFNP